MADGRYALVQALEVAHSGQNALASADDKAAPKRLDFRGSVLAALQHAIISRGRGGRFLGLEKWPSGMMLGCHGGFISVTVVHPGVNFIEHAISLDQSFSVLKHALVLEQALSLVRSSTLEQALSLLVELLLTHAFLHQRSSAMKDFLSLAFLFESPEVQGVTMGFFFFTLLLKLALSTQSGSTSLSFELLLAKMVGTAGSKRIGEKELIKGMAMVVVGGVVKENPRHRGARECGR